jgi:hypothetical protein
VILKGEVLEVRNVDSILHIARKERCPDEWDLPMALWAGHRRNRQSNRGVTGFALKYVS